MALLLAICRTRGTCKYHEVSFGCYFSTDVIDLYLKLNWIDLILNWNWSDVEIDAEFEIEFKIEIEINWIEI